MKASFDNETYTAYRSFPLGVMRADMWRYAVLYKRGGLYADVDVRWVSKTGSRRRFWCYEGGRVAVHSAVQAWQAI